MKPASALPWSQMEIRSPSTPFDLYSIYTMNDNVPEHAHASNVKDAAYIVHACNAYPELIAALREACKPQRNGESLDTRSKGRDLLAKLGEVA
jgi:hypothetical protein